MKTSPIQPIHRKPKGFTLVEVVLGIALLALLFGGIFAVARGALQISAEVTQNQQYSMRIHSYLELLRRTFEEMPGNGKVELRPLSGRGVESEVAFVEYPLAFAWSGVTAGSPVTVFQTTRGPSGWLQSRIYYLDEEMADDYLENGKVDSAAPNLLIMDEIKMLQWRFYDQRTDEWMTEWEHTNNNRPSLIELNVEFLDGSNPIAVIFWIPTVVNPEQIARSLNTSRGGAGAGGVPGRGGEGGRGGRGDRGDRGDRGGDRGGDRPRGGAGGRGGTGGGRGGAQPGGGGRGATGGARPPTGGGGR